MKGILLSRISEPSAPERAPNNCFRTFSPMTQTRRASFSSASLMKWHSERGERAAIVLAGGAYLGLQLRSRQAYQVAFGPDVPQVLIGGPDNASGALPARLHLGASAEYDHHVLAERPGVFV